MPSALHVIEWTRASSFSICTVMESSVESVDQAFENDLAAGVGRVAAAHGAGAYVAVHILHQRRERAAVGHRQPQPEEVAPAVGLFVILELGARVDAHVIVE